jgi:hypothetical protein
MATLRAKLAKSEVFLADKTGTIFVKKLIILTVLALSCVACASNQSTESGDDTSTNASSKSEKKSNCKHVRNSGGLSRIRRTCQPT